MKFSQQSSDTQSQTAWPEIRQTHVTIQGQTQGHLSQTSVLLMRGQALCYHIVTQVFMFCTQQSEVKPIYSMCGVHTSLLLFRTLLLSCPTEKSQANLTTYQEVVILVGIWVTCFFKCLLRGKMVQVYGLILEGTILNKKKNINIDRYWIFN